MHVGFTEKHRHSDEDLTVLQCPVHGWSRPLTVFEMRTSLRPRSCALCRNLTPRFVRFHPDETKQALALLGITLFDWASWLPVMAESDPPA